MKQLILLCFLTFLFPYLSHSQSGYIDSKFSPQEIDGVYEKLDKLAMEYNFSSATSSLYDTLIFNTRDFRADEVPTYSDEVIRRRLEDLPTVIQMDFNAYVKRYVDVYTKERRDQMSKMLGLKEVYFPIFEEALDREGMPIELKYLSIVESALNPHARSRVGAVGLWQFMLSTGRMYGLDVNSYVDERKNPYKSTDAACKYLKSAYGEFGDWLLAIASYNCGQGNVRKAVRRAGGVKNFWAIRRYLPRETRGYVPAFIAATYAFNYASEHNLYPLYVEFEYQADTLHIKKLDISLRDIANMTHTDVEVLRNLNPELKLERIPYSSRTYVLRVPPRVSNYFASNYNAIYRNHSNGRSSYSQTGTPPSSTSHKATASVRSSPRINTGNGTLRYHTVKDGEVVGAIAEAYGVSARNISYWNGLRSYRIKVGQRLKIYSNKTPQTVKKINMQTPSATTAPKPVTTYKGAVYHTVRRGDTIWDIAKRYDGVSTQNIISLNKGVNVKDLKVGTKIRVK